MTTVSKQLHLDLTTKKLLNLKTFIFSVLERLQKVEEEKSEKVGE